MAVSCLICWVDTTFGGVMYMHGYIGGDSLAASGFLLILYTMFVWWRDIIREATYQGHHTTTVQAGLKSGMILFIVSEIMFFLAFFWAFFPSLYCILRNFPIAVYFKKEAWITEGGTESYSSSEDWRNSQHHLSNTHSNIQESILTSPRYISHSCNIYHHK